MVVIIPMIYHRCAAEDAVDEFPGGASAAASSASASAAAAPVKVSQGDSAAVRRRQADGAARRFRKKSRPLRKKSFRPRSGVAGVVGGVPGGVPAALRAACSAASSARCRPRASASASSAEGSKKPVTPQRITVGGNVQAAKLVRQPKPVYPPLAKQARIRVWFA